MAHGAVSLAEVERSLCLSAIDRSACTRVSLTARTRHCTVIGQTFSCRSIKAYLTATPSQNTPPLPKKQPFLPRGREAIAT